MTAQLLLACVLAVQASGDDDASLEAARTATLKTFKVEVAPILNTYCLRCHGNKKVKGGVRFDYAVKTPAVPSFGSLQAG